MQTNINSIIQQIKLRLAQELHVDLQNAWIIDCVKFFVERDSNCDFNSLYENVNDQFQLSALADSANPVISDSFVPRKKDVEWTFNGKMLLQMNFILEITEPFFEQWRRLNNKVLIDFNPEVKESKTFHTKKKRMFKLELTDSYKTIHAMEMKFIKCLNSKLSPGTKVLISGPVKVVNAILFLEPQNIQIIGGEIDDLLIVNAYENLLLKQLNKPTKDDPVKDYKEAVFEEEALFNPRNYHPQTMRPTTTAAPPPQQQQQQKINLVVDDDDDDIDFELLAQIEAEANREYQESQQRKEPTSDIHMVDDLDEEEERRLFEQIDQMTPPPQENIPRATDLLIPKYQISNETSEDMEIDEHFQNALTPKQAPFQTPTFTDDDYKYRIEDKYNYITIDQYNSLSKCEKMKRQYAIEAKVKEVLKLRIEGQSWTFLAILTDTYSKSQLHVRFDDDVVAEFAKRTAREMIAMKERLPMQPQLRGDLNKALALVNEIALHSTLLVSVTMKARLPADYENLIETVISKTDEAKQLMILKIYEENIQLV